jgi:peptide/nickel transport system permease protein
METERAGGTSRASRFVSLSGIKNALKGMRITEKIALVFFILFIFCAFFGNQLAPHNPLETHFEAVLTPPFFQEGGSFEYPLGTDHLGRDMLSRLLAGASLAAIVSFSVVILTSAIGIVLALISGYLGGWVDAVIMRITDAFFCLPFLFFVLLFASVLGPSFINLILAMTIFGWAGSARVFRGLVLQIKQGEFVQLAVVAGASKRRIMFLHIFPNLRNLMVVGMTMGLGGIILAEAGLSFIGFGIPPPAPAWGQMCAMGREYLYGAWWISTLPGIAIFFVVMSVNLLGDWLRFRLDPKFRQL